MFICANPDDGARLISMDKRARCVGECGRWLEPGELAWSYMDSPVDGNYVECGLCRYGAEPCVEPRKACVNTLKAHLAQGNRATRRALASNRP
jgi:hypothetical protein